MGSLYDFTATTLSGKPLPLANYRGKVALVVNTASKCSFTPQYEGLEALHRNYHDRGLEVLCFPCNQFGRQEPGSALEIASFCERHFGVSFQMFDKIDVNGGNAHPLYRWLTSVAPGFLGTRRIKWNFTKFLLGRDGQVVKRYGSLVTPTRIIPDIQKLL